MKYEDFEAKFDKAPVETLREAGEKKMTFTQFANSEVPDCLINDKVNAVSRLWQDEGLVGRTSALSVASPAADFFESEKRMVLLNDYLYRRYINPRNAITTGFEDEIGSILYPGVGSRPRVDEQVAPAIDISEVISTTTDIRGTAYRPFRWVYDEDALERKPIAPGSPVPVTTLSQKEDAIQLNKFGNRFQVTYEALVEFDARIDKLGEMITLEGLREESRMLNELVGVLVSGDTTAGSAAEVIAQTVLDSAATANELSAKAWLAFGMEFDAPYVMTHALMRKAQALQLILLTLGNANIQVSQLINAQAEGIPRLESMNVTADAVRFGRVPDSAIVANRIVGFDSRFSVEMVQMLGGDIQEQATNIVNQTRDVVITNTYNWAKLDFTATKVLNLAA